MLIVDSGPLYAAAATRDRNHARSVELLSAAARPLLVPALVVTEVCYLLCNRLGPQAELAFMRSIAAGELVVEPVLDADWDRIAELTERYLDIPLGVVDASVVALAERHGVKTLASLDHRHISVVRPTRVGAFTLVP
ncbi:MAG: type II toxin-antitoxin system VapC family toxin [Mycobacteriales bacterium]